ncbi:3'-5' exonuclease [Puniceicoccus vermicola]|uniref:3'-5' exonuclease n=1 Tax=Puniceicoccus vermicola TaxID=388746 RepID=A0A7X1AY32_9BACT|nr:3'-5' exonuclease [Puniceicoccus vermicola]MBC2602126.1 3'-5' exonuclease domain-containing protein 2 [Puniceicoccus vermicola]
MNIPADAPFPERMCKEVLRNLPMIGFKGKIELIQDDAQMDSALEELRHETLLGFDTESKPTFRRQDEVRPPALLQLSNGATAWLFQLRQISRHEELFAILADPAVEKVGVAPHDDIKGLNRISPFQAAGFTDLGTIASARGIITTGLRNLAGMFLNGRISKAAQVSNWEQNPLTKKQINYAATDAWVSLRIYEELNRRTGQAVPGEQLAQ